MSGNKCFYIVINTKILFLKKSILLPFPQSDAGARVHTLVCLEGGGGYVAASVAVLGF